MNPNNNWENANILLKDYCHKHYQHIEEIIHPDFAHSCMKCLRETFLKKDYEMTKMQAEKDIEDMKMQYQRILEEFGIWKNIKEEFCAFTSAKLKAFQREMDLKYDTIKKRMEESLQTKLL